MLVRRAWTSLIVGCRECQPLPLLWSTVAETRVLSFDEVAWLRDNSPAWRLLRAAYVIENEITYLAFPLLDGAIVIFGGGYAVDVLESLRWLTDLDLVYWGDIDTHGFVILNRLRRRFRHARSLLMDRATLLAHRGQWVTEPRPAAVSLDLLEPEEAELYQDLLDGTLGLSIRLEQERISFAAIDQALARDPV
jgi:hypothetical protein